MITIHLSPTDLERLRFAYTPLLEVVGAYKLLRHDPNNGRYQRWVNEARRALFGHEFPYLDSLIPPRYYIADFITMTPQGTHHTLESEFERMRALPPEIIRANAELVMRVGGETEIRRHFVAYPHEALECVIEELRTFWTLTLAHHWERIQSALENDVLYRARALALHGVDQMFAELHPKVRYRQSIIEIDKHSDISAANNELNGDGLQLVPVIFGGNTLMWQVEPEWLPMIAYAARGTGTWYRPELPEPAQALELTLGEARARLLQALQTPAHTTELARRLDLTSGAVSQQLGRLHQAGLVEAHRSSSRVYYRLTERGLRLIELFSRS